MNDRVKQFDSRSQWQPQESDWLTCLSRTTIKDNRKRPCRWSEVGPTGFPARAADTPSPAGEITMHLRGACQSAHSSAAGCTRREPGHGLNAPLDYGRQVRQRVLWAIRWLYASCSSADSKAAHVKASPWGRHSRRSSSINTGKLKRSQIVSIFSPLN